jgi:hypothetical protein
MFFVKHIGHNHVLNLKSIIQKGFNIDLHVSNLHTTGEYSTGVNPSISFKGVNRHPIGSEILVAPIFVFGQ